MSKREFQAESKRLLDLMINSIYTEKEIFLRELISNASDAMDKMYYRALTDDSIEFNKDDYYIEIKVDEDERTLIIKDRGIGMTKEELDLNLGTIAKSGSYDFKSSTELKEDFDIIGQFGVGFYSAFMVADEISVLTRSIDSDQGYKWHSTGEDGYTIEEYNKEDIGTEIYLKLKEDRDGENYSDYLLEYRLVEIIKKYSDYIRYPIKMELTHTRIKEGTEDEIESYTEIETVNSMVPIWRMNKNDLKDEDYINFYHEKRYGFDQPLKTIHMQVDGLIRFQSILFIPRELPFNYYQKEFEKGLELYSSGVMIMEKTPELIPDYFSFVRGVVDSEDLSLNISREMLQNTRELRVIGKNIEKKINDELKSLLENEREDYEAFFKNFGPQIKFGIYDGFGVNKDKLQDLVLFYSSKDKKLTTFKEYVDRMKDDQEFIYYIAGDSLDKVDKLPQTESLKDKGYEILYLLDPMDEFVVRTMLDYDGKEFRNVSTDDLGLEIENKEALEESAKENKELFDKIKELLGEEVKKVKPTDRLKSHPVCLSTEGEISIEMEKLLKLMPEGENMTADKVLEINIEHDIFKKLKTVYEEDEDLFKLYVELLYDQARLIEGLEISDPVKFANNICRLM